MNNEQAAISGKTKNLMILLHGLGSNGDDLFSLVPFLQSELRDTHFFAPDGIEGCDMSSFGYQWFSLQDRAEDVLLKEIERNSDAILGMIEDKAKELGLGLKDVILLGFSQGTMTSLYLTLSRGIDFKAVIGFSGALIKPLKPIVSKTPICLIHGQEDSVVPHGGFEKARRILRDLKMEAESLSIQYLDHSIDMSGLQKAAEFIKKLDK